MVDIKLIIFTIVFCICSCNARVPENNTSLNIKVEPCGFDYDIDDYYCKADKIKLYKENLGNNVDYNKDYTVIKITDGKYIRLVALNQKNKMVYPLNYQIGKDKSKIDYSVYSDILCVTGDLYGYRNTYNNSKICFKVVDGDFVKISIDEDINSSKKNSFQTVKIPNSSEYFSQCLKVLNQTKCEKSSNLENHVYMLDTISKESKNIEKILKSENIRKLSLNGFKFLPELGQSQYLIGEKYKDTDDGVFSEYYLIKIKPDIYVQNLGYFYSIDKQGNLIYKDAGGHKKNIKLN